MGSLLAPFVAGPFVRRLAPGRTKGGTALLALGAAAGVVTTGDVAQRRREHGGPLHLSRFGSLLRGPGWAYARRERGAAEGAQPID